MSCRRHCPPPKNGVEHRYLVTLESSIDSSSLSQPLRSKPDMQQSTFDTSRRLLVSNVDCCISGFDLNGCDNELESMELSNVTRYRCSTPFLGGGQWRRQD